MVIVDEFVLGVMLNYFLCNWVRMFLVFRLFRIVFIFVVSLVFLVNIIEYFLLVGMCLIMVRFGLFLM